jgi:hypothetical protein
MKNDTMTNDNHVDDKDDDDSVIGETIVDYSDYDYDRNDDIIDYSYRKVLNDFHIDDATTTTTTTTSAILEQQKSQQQQQDRRLIEYKFMKQSLNDNVNVIHFETAEDILYHSISHERHLQEKEQQRQQHHDPFLVDENDIRLDYDLDIDTLAIGHGSFHALNTDTPKKHRKHHNRDDNQKATAQSKYYYYYDVSPNAINLPQKHDNADTNTVPYNYGSYGDNNDDDENDVDNSTDNQANYYYFDVPQINDDMSGMFVSVKHRNNKLRRKQQQQQRQQQQRHKFDLSENNKNNNNNNPVGDIDGSKHKHDTSTTQNSHKNQNNLDDGSDSVSTIEASTKRTTSSSTIVPEDPFKDYINWATTDNPDGVSIVNEPIDQVCVHVCLLIGDLAHWLLTFFFFLMEICFSYFSSVGIMWIMLGTSSIWFC